MADGDFGVFPTMQESYNILLPHRSIGMDYEADFQVCQTYVQQVVGAFDW